MSDSIDRAQAMTELQMSAKRLTLAYEAHGEGRVEYSDIIIRLSDALDTLRGLPSALPTYTDTEIKKMQDMEQAQLEKAYQLGYEEGKKDIQPETAKRIICKSRDGMTFWHQCDMCNEPVDVQDNYCRGCGRRLVNERLDQQTRCN